MDKNSIIKKQFILFAFLAKMTKLVKLLKFGKIFLTFATMCLSAFIYSFSMGAWFSTGFVVLLFVHEMGHVIALRFKGLPASAPVFIPFIGAAIFSPSFKGKENESFVGIGGPLLGGVSCLVMFALWKTTPGHPNILLMLSYTATIINLFNLIPLRPLDGGRITQIIGPWSGAMPRSPAMLASTAKPKSLTMPRSTAMPRSGAMPASPAMLRSPTMPGLRRGQGLSGTG
jgi:Zn-dependent protease